MKKLIALAILSTIFLAAPHPAQAFWPKDGEPAPRRVVGGNTRA